MQIAEMWKKGWQAERNSCLLYTSDAADERSSVDLGGRRIIKKKTYNNTTATNSSVWCIHQLLYPKQVLRQYTKQTDLKY